MLSGANGLPFFAAALERDEATAGSFKSPAHFSRNERIS
jgi:hypothetical protein